MGVECCKHNMTLAPGIDVDGASNNISAAMPRNPQPRAVCGLSGEWDGEAKESCYLAM